MSSGWLIVNDAGRQRRVAIASDRVATWVFHDGRVWKIDTQVNDGRPRRKGRGESSVMAPMPATVVAITAVPGQAVKEGDTVIVLEAMKMELPIKAPRAGVVKTVNCTKGELVQPGVNLVELE